MISWEPTSAYLPKGVKVEVTGSDPEPCFTPDELCRRELLGSGDEIISRGGYDERFKRLCDQRRRGREENAIYDSMNIARNICIGHEASRTISGAGRGEG